MCVLRPPQTLFRSQDGRTLLAASGDGKVGYFQFGDTDFNFTPLTDAEFLERKKEVYAKSNLVNEAQGEGLGEILTGPSTLNFEVLFSCLPSLQLRCHSLFSIFLLIFSLFAEKEQRGVGQGRRDFKRSESGNVSSSSKA